jgi:hypothetical protein
MCESHRGKKCHDLFTQGQDLFCLFLQDAACLVQQKGRNSMEWEAMSLATLTTLQSEDCGWQLHSAGKEAWQSVTSVN